MIAEKNWNKVKVMIMKASSFLTIVLLITILQLYIALSAMVFRALEKPTNNAKKDINKKLVNVIKKIQTKSRIENSDRMIKDLKKALKEDEKIEMKESFGDISRSYLFTLTSFSTLGMYLF